MTGVSPVRKQSVLSPNAAALVHRQAVLCQDIQHLGTTDAFSHTTSQPKMYDFHSYLSGTVDSMLIVLGKKNSVSCLAYSEEE